MVLLIFSFLNRSFGKGAVDSDEDEELSENEAEYAGDVELNPDDERAMAMFMTTAEEGPRRTLADAVMEKLRAVEGGFSGGKDQVEEAVTRTMNPKVVQVYRGYDGCVWMCGFF